MGKSKYNDVLERINGRGYCRVVPNCTESWEMKPGANTTQFTRHAEKEHAIEWTEFQAHQTPKVKQSPTPAKRPKLEDFTPKTTGLAQAKITSYCKRLSVSTLLISLF